MFRACADQTRLRLLNLLRSGELCVCDLVEVLNVPQPTASRHLANLRRAGLVRSRKQGLWSYYSLAPASGEFHQRLLQCLADCEAEVRQLSKDVRRLHRLKQSGDCCPETCG